MDDVRLIETVQALADAFVASGRAVPADTTVPTCPDWTLAALADHVALELAGWYYSNLTLAPGTADPIAAAMAAAPERSEGYVALIDYVEGAAARFAEQARKVDLDADVWVFDDIGPARFWLRQTVLEVGLHADDAAGAVGHPSPLDAEIATEAIGQYVGNLAHHGRWWGEPHAPPPQPIGIVVTDTARVAGPGRRESDRRHAGSR